MVIKDRLLDESDGTFQYVCGNPSCGHIAMLDRRGSLQLPGLRQQHQRAPGPDQRMRSSCSWMSCCRLVSPCVFNWRTCDDARCFKEDRLDQVRLPVP